jgi:sugar lactone lactonase YvrE
MSEVECVLPIRNELGEGPLWSVEEQALYWVDIYGNCFYRYDPVAGTWERFDVGIPIGCLGLRAAGGLVMATQDGFALWDFHSKTMTFVGNPEAGKEGARFNDGAVDPQGRFWAGTMAPGATSALYRLDPDLSIHTMETGITVSNGIGWSPDHTIMYYTDTRRHVIYAYDYDEATGAITNRRPFVHTPDEAGVPDGLAVDSEGYVWSARWGGWKVIRYDPSGRKVLELPMPVEYPSSCTFGGAQLDDLYITSARTRLTDEERKSHPLAGGLFRVKVNVKGQRASLFRG